MLVLRLHTYNCIKMKCADGTIIALRSPISQHLDAQGFKIAIDAPQEIEIWREGTNNNPEKK